MYLMWPRWLYLLTVSAVRERTKSNHKTNQPERKTLSSVDSIWGKSGKFCYKLMHAVIPVFRLLLPLVTCFSGLSPILIRIALERQPFMMICFFLLILLCSFLLYIWLISLAASPGSLLNFGLTLWLKCTWPKGLIFSAQARHVTVCTVQACLLRLRNMTYVWMSVCLSVCM